MRTNNAAVVAEGAVKPTSVYSVVRVEDKLVVVAHLSEGIPRYWLLDNTALETFVDNELQYGLQTAVEAKVLADVNGTSGIQTQAYATSVLTTLRKGLTKLETAGYTASAIVLHPTDWEGVELALSTHERHRAPEPAVRPGQPSAVRGAGDHHQRAGRRRRARIGNRRCRFGHRHPRRRRAVVRECDRRQFRQEPRLRQV